MKRGHFDAGFGISGDMALGALLHAGARLERVNAALTAVGVPGLRVETETVQRCAITCLRAHVRYDGSEPAYPPGTELLTTSSGEGTAQPHGHPRDPAPRATATAPEAVAPHHEHHRPHHHSHRPYAEIRRLLAAAALAPAVRDRAQAVFARLAEAEGRIHGVPAAEVHLHEVGGEDAIGDVVGVAAALEDLDVGALSVGPLPSGGGLVSAAHGLLPVPAPAVVALLVGFHFQPGPVAAELVTPTGAAILAALAEPAPFWPAWRLGGAGWGAGARDFQLHPNACRFVWGDADTATGLRSERLVEIETHIDDQSPEGIGYLFERLVGVGAMDVAVAPLMMKKQRPGIRLWALVRPEAVAVVRDTLLAESTALGLRLREVERWSLPRSWHAVDTPYGRVRIKAAWRDGALVNAAPEYEDCRAAALASGVPLKRVFAVALAAWEACALTVPPPAPAD